MGAHGRYEPCSGRQGTTLQIGARQLPYRLNVFVSVPVIPAYADRSEGDFGIFFLGNVRDFLFWIFEPPGSPNRLKMMPRGIGSISTPADFLSGIFKISKFSDFWTWGPQNLGLGVLNRTWGPQNYRTWGPQQDMGSSTFLGLGVLNRTWGPQHF